MITYDNVLQHLQLIFSPRGLEFTSALKISLQGRGRSVCILTARFHYVLPEAIFLDCFSLEMQGAMAGHLHFLGPTCHTEGKRVVTCISFSIIGPSAVQTCLG